MDLTEKNIEDRRAAKSKNERLKLVSTLFNNGTLAMLTTAILGPIISRKLEDVRLDFIFLAVACQLVAHGILLRYYKSED